MRDHEPDPLAAGRMPFGDHLEELRWRLWRALTGFGAALGLVLALDMFAYATALPVGLARPAFDLLTAPAEAELRKFYDRQAEQLRTRLRADDPRVRAVNADREVFVRVELASALRAVSAALGREVPGAEPSAAEVEHVLLPVRIAPVDWVLVLHEARRLLRPPSLKAMGAAEGMVVYLKVALLCGVLVGSPWLFGQLWAFVAAGLYPHEKRLVHVYLPASLALFFAGVAVCQVWVMPKTVEALFGFNEWLDVEPDLRLNEWLNFALLMPLVFGVAFQTPLVMWCLDRLGVVDAAAFGRHRRAAWFALAAGAAVLTPGADVYSMLYLWLPLVVLYEAGVGLCRLPRGRVCKSEEGSLS